MAEVGALLAALARIALIPLFGYAVVKIARGRPRTTLTLLLVLLVGGVVALSYTAQDGLRVDPDSRKMEFGSMSGRWCFTVGGVLAILTFPALPLVAIACSGDGPVKGPVGAQWVAVLFGYFMACAIFGMVLYSFLTGIVK